MSILDGVKVGDVILFDVVDRQIQIQRMVGGKLVDLCYQADDGSCEGVKIDWAGGEFGLIWALSAFGGILLREKERLGGGRIIRSVVCEVSGLHLVEPS